MRVLHINCNYIGTPLHQIMNENLEALGYENSVFVPTYNRNLSVIKPKENVCVCECFRKWDRLLFDYKQRKICKALKNQYVVQNFDLIHAYTLFTDGNCARNLYRQYGVPYVVAVRNTDVNDFFRLMPHLRARGLRILLDAKKVFFLSEAYQNIVFKKYIPKKYHEKIRQKVQIIPNGIDDFWLEHPAEKLNKMGDIIKLIYAGRIDRNKNIPTIQKAAEILRKKGYALQLTVVGKASDKRLLAKIKKDPFTRYLPVVPKEELLGLYRAHNIFVMPSFTESFGLVYAEAMSQGLPIIYSAGQGFDCQFPEGKVGYRVFARNPESVAEQIEKVIQNFDEISANTVPSAKVFCWQNIAKKYDAIYRTFGANEKTGNQ